METTGTEVPPGISGLDVQAVLYIVVVVKVQRDVKEMYLRAPLFS